MKVVQLQKYALCSCCARLGIVVSVQVKGWMALFKKGLSGLYVFCLLPSMYCCGGCWSELVFQTLPCVVEGGVRIKNCSTRGVLSWLARMQNEKASIYWDGE